MIKIPNLNNTLEKRKKYSNQRASKKNYNPNKEININNSNNKKSHSFIFNYSGLNKILSKYNSNKVDNTKTSDENTYLSEEQNKIKRKSMGFLDKNSSLNKLKEMNSNMDSILTQIKTNLEGSTINSEKKIINADRFINPINTNKNTNSSINNKSKQETINKTYEYLKHSFSYMKISYFNFEIRNKKKH